MVEYDGAGFHGWQIQTTDRSVQGALETALARVAAHPISTICAGRTDAGVHATSQVVHFDSPVERSLEAWTRGVNANLPDEVRVLRAVPVPPDFHARFGALSRRYRFFLLNRRAPSALHRHRAVHVPRALDVKAMSGAAEILVGEHDFSAFRASGCQAAQPVRTVQSLSVRRAGPWVVVEIVANAFLQNMVRIIVGSLMRVGHAERDERWLADTLAARDRDHAGVTVPPHGLYLSGVRYEPRFGVPSDITDDALFSPSSIMIPAC
ncbi:MAG: tRNA pseudouridine(38-40) synthase TruA [Pseudomonadota bacterium]